MGPAGTNPVAIRLMEWSGRAPAAAASEAGEGIERLNARIDGLSREIEALARQDQACPRLMTVPGVDHLE